MAQANPDSLRLSWTVTQGSFDSFVVQYKDAQGQPQAVPVRGDENEVTIPGLESHRKYKMNLYGLHGRQRVGPVSVVATTGESGPPRPPSEQDLAWGLLQTSLHLLLLGSNPARPLPSTSPHPRTSHPATSPWPFPWPCFSIPQEEVPFSALQTPGTPPPQAVLPTDTLSHCVPSPCFLPGSFLYPAWLGLPSFLSFHHQLPAPSHHCCSAQSWQIQGVRVLCFPQLLSGVKRLRPRPPNP